jgi:YidC/Oxa1 family membrane protein insertase
VAGNPPSAGSGSVVGGVLVVGSPQAISSKLGSEIPLDKEFPLQLDISPQGAGLDSVTLNDFWETAEHKNLYVYQKPFPEQESLTRPLATRWITINGQQLDVSNINWARTACDQTSVTYVAHVTDSGKPLLEMSKTFTIRRRNSPDDYRAFQIAVSQNFINQSAKPITIHETLNGPSAPARDNDRSEDRQFITGNDDGDKHVVDGHVTLGEIARNKAQKDLVAIQPYPLLWLGAASSYFEALIVPDYAGQPGNPPVKIASAIAAGLDPGSPDSKESPTALSINTSDVTLAPGASVPFNFSVYLGPKWRKFFEDGTYYAEYPRRFETTLVNTSGMCGFITFSWLINALYGILWFFHKITFDWGLSIICLVVLVRSCLHPITKRSQIQMLKMGKMGPEIERLKKKHGDNKDELNKAMMQVYKQQGAAPVLGCLPMFLQTPIWIALWSALQSTFELRQAGFLRFGGAHLTWIADLSKPDNLYVFHVPIPVLGFFTLSAINVLPLLLAVVFFINQALQPVPPNMTPEQEQQRKMMKWMSLLFPVMLYPGPSGLNLYILTSTTIGIIESKIIRNHIKQREEAEKAGRIIIDSPPTRGSKRKRDETPRDKQKTSGISAWIENLQAKFEQAKREAERRAKDRA